MARHGALEHFALGQARLVVDPNAVPGIGTQDQRFDGNTGSADLSLVPEC